jgi:bisphosphoglycerate-dependent phosphoglycerate mutase
MPRSKVIYLLRHGEAKHNLYDTGPGSYERRRDPALMDPPLTEKGVAQVEAAKQEIEEEPCPIMSNQYILYQYNPIHILDYFRAILLHTSNLNNILQF